MGPPVATGATPRELAGAPELSSALVADLATAPAPRSSGGTVATRPSCIQLTINGVATALRNSG